MNIISDRNRPSADHIFFDEKNGINEAYNGTKRDPQPGRCVYFNGTNKVSSTIPVVSSDVVVITGWFKLLTPDTKFVFSNSAGTIRILYFSSGDVRFYCGDVSGTNYINTTGKSYNTWYHFAMVLCKNSITGKSANQYAFLNNVEIGGISTNVTDASDVWTASNTFNLGGWRTSDNYTYAGNVGIFDFKIQECSNDWTTITSIIADSYTQKYRTSLLHLKLDEGAGSTAFDSSGNGRHGTWTGLVASSHYTGSDVPYSYQNEVGTNMGTYFPNGSHYSTPAIVDLSLKNLYIEVEFYNGTDNDGGEKHVAGNRNGNNWFMLYKINKTLSWQYRHNYPVYLATIGHKSGIAIEDNKLTKVTFEQKDGFVTIQVWQNGVLLGTHNNAFDYDLTSDKIFINKGFTAGYYGIYTKAKAVVNNVTLFDVDFRSANPNIGNLVKTGTPSFSSIPRNEANPTKDVLGNDLQFRGKAPVNIALKGSHCGYFNGTHAVLFQLPQNPFTIPNGSRPYQVLPFELEFSMTYSGSARVPLDFCGNYVYFATNSRFIVNGFGAKYDASSNTQTTYGIPTTGDLHIKITKEWMPNGNDQVTKVFVNGNLIDGLTNINAAVTMDKTEVNVGKLFNNTLYHVGTVYNIKFTENGIVKFHAPLSEGGGTTIHNLVGTTHGTLTGDATVFWSNTQNVFHYNLTKGFNLVGGVKIPAKNGTQDALNNTLTHPAINGYNYAETSIDFTGGVLSPYSAKLKTLVPTIDNWKGELLTAANVYNRKITNKIDRILLNNSYHSLNHKNHSIKFSGKDDIISTVLIVANKISETADTITYNWYTSITSAAESVISIPFTYPLDIGTANNTATIAVGNLTSSVNSVVYNKSASIRNLAATTSNGINYTVSNTPLNISLSAKSIIDIVHTSVITDTIITITYKARLSPITSVQYNIPIDATYLDNSGNTVNVSTTINAGSTEVTLATVNYDRKASDYSVNGTLLGSSKYTIGISSVNPSISAEIVPYSAWVGATVNRIFGTNNINVNYYTETNPVPNATDGTVTTNLEYRDTSNNVSTYSNLHGIGTAIVTTNRVYNRTTVGTTYVQLKTGAKYKAVVGTWDRPSTINLPISTIPTATQYIVNAIAGQDPSSLNIIWKVNLEYAYNVDSKVNYIVRYYNPSDGNTYIIDAGTAVVTAGNTSVDMNTAFYNTAGEVDVEVVLTDVEHSSNSQYSCMIYSDPMYNTGTITVF